MTSVKERLETKLREAKQKQKQLEEQLDQKPEFGMGKGSTGTVSWEMAFARKESITAQIKGLEEALTRVNEGSYGVCESCGRQIDPERLEVLPTTKLCAACV
jgi:RNA polymerase-binding transcription factor DksA